MPELASYIDLNAVDVNLIFPLPPAIVRRLNIYSLVSSKFRDIRWHLTTILWFNWRSSGSFNFSLSSGWPTRTIWRSFIFSVSKFDNSLTISSAFKLKFCASSIITTAFPPCCAFFSRKAFKASSCSFRDELCSVTPKSSFMALINSMSDRKGVRISAFSTFEFSLSSRTLQMVVFPVPTSPDSIMNPLRSDMPKNRRSNAS